MKRDILLIILVVLLTLIGVDLFNRQQEPAQPVLITIPNPPPPPAASSTIRGHNDFNQSLNDITETAEGIGNLFEAIKKIGD